MTTSPVTAALAVIGLAQQRRFTEIQEQFAPQLRPTVPAEAVAGDRNEILRRAAQRIRMQAAVHDHLHNKQIRMPRGIARE